MSKHTPTPIDRFVEALRTKDPNWPIKESGGVHYTRCPAHGGRDDDSLSFTSGEDGRLLVHCHSRSCRFETIMDAVGLKTRDAFPARRKLPIQSRPRPAASQNPLRGSGEIKKIDTRALKTSGPQPHPDPGPTDTIAYDYEDELGNIVLKVVRAPAQPGVPGAERKTFYQQRSVGDGFANTLKPGWFMQKRGQQFELVAGPDEPAPSADAVLEPAPARRPLYHLREVRGAVLAGETILIVEGEKDVETARGLGLVATTNPGGAGKWRPEHTEALKGAFLVVVIPDNDQAGRDHADAVAREVVAGVDELRILELPDLGEKEDLTDWVRKGGDANRLRALIDEAPPFEVPEPEELTIVEHPPARLYRPLALIGDRGFLYTTVTLKGPHGHEEAKVVADEDNVLYCDKKLPGAYDLNLLPFTVQVSAEANSAGFISPAGMKRLQAGENVDPCDVFTRIVESVQEFVDFSRSLASPETMARLVALLVMQTYYLEAFTKIGYIWIQGPPGSGKTTLLLFMKQLAFMAEFLTPTSTYASIRDLAACGATLGIDDSNGLRDSNLKPELHSLLLAGNSRDATTVLKVPSGNNGWTNARVPAFGFRFFTATVTPNEVLASRSIQIPLIPTGDPQKANRDPEVPSQWGHEPNRLRDDLWIMGLHNLSRVQVLYSEVHSERLWGRALEPWRPVLALAALVAESGGPKYSGLVDEIHELAVGYQANRQEIDYDQKRQVHVFVRALWQCCPNSAHLEAPLDVAPGDVAEKMTELAKAEGLHDDEYDTPYITPRRVGGMMTEYRFPKGQRTNSQKRRLVRRREVLELADALGLQLDDDPRGPKNMSADEGLLEVSPNDDQVTSPVPQCPSCPPPGVASRVRRRLSPGSSPWPAGRRTSETFKLHVGRKKMG